MQLITLNIWGGHVYQPLVEFISTHQEVDIFCFQEVYHGASEKISTEDRWISLNIFAELQKLLPNHNGFFRPVVENKYGIATFIKNNIKVFAEDEVIIHRNHYYSGRGPEHSRNLQWLHCYFEDRDFFVFNVHGLWNGKGKTDSPERIAQSQSIKTFIETINAPKILCGDFNLNPNTQSMSILEPNMINLIKTHHITSTRTRFYPKEGKFADYVLISPDIKPQQFSVLNDEVSDHAPLFLEFTLNSKP